MPAERPAAAIAVRNPSAYFAVFTSRACEAQAYQAEGQLGGQSPGPRTRVAADAHHGVIDRRVAGADGIRQPTQALFWHLCDAPPAGATWPARRTRSPCQNSQHHHHHGGLPVVAPEPMQVDLVPVVQRKGEQHENRKPRHNQFKVRMVSGLVDGLKGQPASCAWPCLSTPSRRALPGLKWGTSFRDQNLLAGRVVATHAGWATVDRKAAETANLDSVASRQGIDMASRMVLTANSASRWVSCPKRSARRANADRIGSRWVLKSEAVMNAPYAGGSLITAPDRGSQSRRWSMGLWCHSPHFKSLNQPLFWSSLAFNRAPRLVVPEPSGCCRCSDVAELLVAQRCPCLDRQLDVAGLAIDVDDRGCDFVAFLQHVASVFQRGRG